MSAKPPSTPPQAGLAITFDVLAASSDQATDVLLPSLDAPHRSIRDGALVALLRRRSAVAQREILERLADLEREAEWRDLISQYPGGLSQGIRDAVLSADRQLATIACRTAIWLEEYELLPALVTALETPGNPLADVLGPALVSLTDTLHSQLRAPRDRRRGADPEAMRQRLLPKLEAAIRQPRTRSAHLIEAYLILVEHETPALREILDDPHHSCYVPFVQVLSHSPRAAVMELILNHFLSPQAPTTIVAAVSSRGDAEFLSRLVKRIGAHANAAVIGQLRRVETLPWARGSLRAYDTLDGAGQAAAVQILMLSSMNRLEVFRSIEHLLLRGRPAGRVAAANALAEFNGVEANQLALKALNDKDPAVVAAVARQLRQRAIPGALQKLIDLLDSTHDVVRVAAREALAEFTFARFIATYDSLGEEARRSTGALVRKIDPQTDALLVEEMRSDSRSRRLRAVSAAATIEAVGAVGDTVIKLLRDEDHLVRLEAARALAQYPTPQARDALYAAWEDRSTLVRDAIRHSLEEIETRLGESRLAKPQEAAHG